MTSVGNDESRLLSQAVELHKGGFFAAAQKRYAQILTFNPGHLDALNLGGLLAFQTGDIEQAMDYLNSAILLDPDFSDAQYHLGLVHQAKGNPLQDNNYNYYYYLVYSYN